MANNKTEKKTNKNAGAKSWAIKITIATFFITMGMSIVAEFFMGNMAIWAAGLLVLVIVCIGILSDMVGTAIASAEMTPFLSMAAKKVPGAQKCIQILRNAPSYTNICNDVVGDICGIVSGAAGISIAAKIFMGSTSTQQLWGNIALSSLIAALTVGGKALGKFIAIRRSKDIVYMVGYSLSLWKREDKR